MRSPGSDRGRERSRGRGTLGRVSPVYVPPRTKGTARGSLRFRRTDAARRPCPRHAYPAPLRAPADGLGTRLPGGVAHGDSRGRATTPCSAPHAAGGDARVPHAKGVLEKRNAGQSTPPVLRGVLVLLGSSRRVGAEGAHAAAGKVRRLLPLPDGLIPVAGSALVPCGLMDAVRLPDRRRPRRDLSGSSAHCSADCGALILRLLQGEFKRRDGLCGGPALQTEKHKGVDVASIAAPGPRAIRRRGRRAPPRASSAVVPRDRSSPARASARTPAGYGASPHRPSRTTPCHGSRP